MGAPAGVTTARVSAVELERAIGTIGSLRADGVGEVSMVGRVVDRTSAGGASDAIEGTNSAVDSDTKGKPVSGNDSVTSVAVALNGMTGEAELTAGIGSTGAGTSEAGTLLRDAGCSPLRTLTGENGGITVSWAGAGAAKSVGDPSTVEEASGN